MLGGTKTISHGSSNNRHDAMYAVHGAGGKRRPVAQLPQGSSDEEDINDKSLETNKSKANQLTIEIPCPESPISPISPNLSALADHDYENVASPGSSTSSGPIYVRPAGFKYHGQEIKQSKSKKKKTISLKDGLRRGEPIPPKGKPRRDPLPMRMRALPQSFWNEPNRTLNESPANQVSSHVLPPLMKFDGKNPSEDIMDVRPVTPPEEKEPKPKKPAPRPERSERTQATANTDLLFKLFDCVEEKKTKKTDLYNTPPSKTSIFRRGRPRKLLPPSNTKGVITGEDACMVEGISDKIFPKLKSDGTKANGALANGHQSLQIVTVRQGDKTLCLPQLAMEQNYSQMLSELVMHI
ncbi:unnamed protein product [Owenia fusiformis]|uniref:Uncharacterized protein n=1 Tax=Owenia fusiformis TaxID=6347 RepID=A0A8S4N2F1_OWEFU|nr:unnamed protein product [Owenia fusiformis]